MWIRRVAVQHWRGLDFEIADLSPHLNLVFGPNEAGKSRLVEAMRFALFESSSGKSQHKKALASWGGTDKPSVTLEFELGGTRWQLQKTFLGTGHNTTLRSDSEGLEGVEAENRLAQVIGVGQGGRKAVDADDLGIWSVLWVEQGDSREAPAHNVVSQAQLQDHLTREIGEAAAGELGQDVLHRAETMRQQYYSAARDAERAPLLEPQARVTELSGRLQDARARRDAVAADADALDEKRAAERNLVARVAEAYARLDAVQALDQSARELGARLERHDVELDSAEHQRDRCRERLEGAQALEGEVGTLDQRVQAAATGLAGADAERTPAQAEADEASRLTAEADQQHAEAERQMAALLRQQELAQLRKEAETLRGRLRAADTIGERIAAIQHELGALPQVSAKEIERIRGALQVRDAAEARLEGAAVSIELLAQQDLTLAGEPLTAGSRRRVLVEDEQRLEVDGVLSITVRPGGGELPKLRDAKRDAERALSQLLEACSVEDVAQAEQIAERRRDLQVELERARTELTRHLPEGREAADAALREVEGRLAREPSDADAEPFDQDALQQLQGVVRQATAHKDTMRARRDVALQRLADAREMTATRTAERQAAMRQLEEVRARRAALPELPDLQAAFDSAERQWREQVVVHDALEREFEALGGGDIELDLEQAARAHSQLTHELQQVREARATLAARLEAAGDDGRHERAQELEAELAEAEVALARVVRQAAAARRLHEVLLAEYEQARERLAAPVIARIRPYLQSLFPNTEVWLDEDLNLRGLRGRDTDQDFAALSGGAREQLALLVRVGLAEVLGSDESHPLVLDDVLVNTDAERIRLVQRMLFQASRHMQVLLFTCHGPMFDALGADKRVDLAAS